VRKVEAVASGILNSDTAELEAINLNIATLDNWISPAPLNLVPTQIARPELLILQAQKDKAGAINMLRGPVAMLVRQSETLRHLMGALVPMEKDDTPRTGDLKLTFGILNKGDSDGVVSNRATLKFDGGELWLVVADSWTSVKAHSLQEVDAQVGGDDDSGKSTKLWHKLVAANKPFDVEIVLNSNADLTRPVHKVTLSK